jgi:hypothetical protein
VKPRVVLICAALAVLVAVGAAALLLAPSPFGSREIAFEKEKGLSERTAISAKTRVGDLGVHKGDAFPYFLEVWYNPAQVSEIDRAGLDRNVNLEPFEIRGVKERDYKLDSRTRVYQREYELQLINGEVNQRYEFPTLLVRYKRPGSEGLVNEKVIPAPIFVAPRLPAEVPDLEFGYGPLRPIAWKTTDPSRQLPWILWTLGGVLAGLGIFDLAWRILPQRREMAERRRRGEGVDRVSAVYRSLSQNVAAAAEPKRALQQVDHLLRIVLARKENADWLEEPNLDIIPAETRESVVSLFDRCQTAYGSRVVAQTEVEDALRQIEGILSFYFGKEEVAAWRS